MTVIGHYQMESACCTAPSTGKNLLGRGKKPCLLESADRKVTSVFFSQNFHELLRGNTGQENPSNFWNFWETAKKTQTFVRHEKNRFWGKNKSAIYFWVSSPNEEHVSFFEGWKSQMKSNFLGPPWIHWMNPHESMNLDANVAFSTLRHSTSPTPTLHSLQTQDCALGSTLYTAHSALYTPPTLYAAYATLNIQQSKLHTLHCTLRINKLFRKLHCSSFQKASTLFKVAIAKAILLDASDAMLTCLVKILLK